MELKVSTATKCDAKCPVHIIPFEVKNRHSLEILITSRSSSTASSQVFKSQPTLEEANSTSLTDQRNVYALLDSP